MNTLSKFLTAAALVAAPVAVFAQSVSPQEGSALSRADVNQQLRSVESAGYSPEAGSRNYYPLDVQAAQQQVDEQTPAVAQARQYPVADTRDSSGYGAPGGSTYQSGVGQNAGRMSYHNAMPDKSVYFGN